MMTKLEIKNIWDKAAVSIASTNYETTFEKMQARFIAAFGFVPNVIALIAEGEYLNPNLNDNDYGNYSKCVTPCYINDEIDDEDDEDLCRTFKNIAVPKTIRAFYEHFKNTCYIYRHLSFPVIIGEKMLIYYDTYNNEIFVMQDQEQLREDIKNLIVDVPKDESIRIVYYITHNQRGFNKTPMEVKKINIDLDGQYNDDLPYNEIINFLTSDKSGLVLLHGVPGTGKTYFIRHLMYTLFKKKFLILDNSVFNFITDASFIQLLINNKNAIIILEDCEEMLINRTAGNNKLAALLNLSDGIIGDSFNFKFICTFNTNTSKLDSALLRKGRLKLKYEFKKLTANKVHALAQKIGKNIKTEEDMTLADIFNYGEDNGGNKIERKIGFGN